MLAKSARRVQVPRIPVKAERSGLWAVSEAWSRKAGCLDASQRRLSALFVEQRNHSYLRRFTNQSAIEMSKSRAFEGSIMSTRRFLAMDVRFSA